MIRKISSPFQKFVKAESLAGILLFGSTILALILANTSLAEWYHNIWQTELGFSFGSFQLTKPLILWVNDGLMAIFFFLIGLELKRELLTGELNSLKKAGLPVLAAFGGVIVPIILYFLLNQTPETAQGWGIPMATDIAFALAVLMLLGQRIPLSVKVFLTAFAIIDDLAAVLVIAIFYSHQIQISLLILALVLIALLAWYYHKIKFSLSIGLIDAVIIWILFLKSGIHPTIAGVLLAFTIPLKKKIRLKAYIESLHFTTQNLAKNLSTEKSPLLKKDTLQYISFLDEATAKVRSPLQYLENKLHGFIAYFVLPVFAFANAGISLNNIQALNISLAKNIAIALFLGKFLGVSTFTLTGLKLKIISLPQNMTFKHIIGIAAISGIGFTMSMFIANLAFAGNNLLIDSAKLGIVAGSLIAGISGYLILRFWK